MLANPTETRALEIVKALSASEKVSVLERLLSEITETDLSKFSLPSKAVLQPAATKPAIAISLPLESARRFYTDNRKGFGPHEAIAFTVRQERQVPTSNLLMELLGQAEAVKLISNWSNRVDFNELAPSINHVILFTESNDKARNRKFSDPDDITTQEEDLKGVGLKFADDTEATIVCATLVRKAKDAGLDIRQEGFCSDSLQSVALAKLNEFEIDLLTKLRYGIVRTCFGGLSVGPDGRLSANSFGGTGDINIWALAREVTDADHGTE